LQSLVGFIFFHNKVVTGYNRTSGELAALLKEKKISSHVTVWGLATSIETMPHERMYPGIVNTGAMVYIPCIRREIPSNEANTGYKPHRSGSLTRMHCQKSVILVVHPLSIGIFSPRSFSPYAPGNTRNESRGITSSKNQRAPKKWNRRAGL
jgi:hypothetical protein